MTPAQAAPAAVQAAAASGELVLRRDGAAGRLLLPGGGELVVSLPARTELAAVAGAPHAWAAVGTTPERDGASRLLVLAGDADRARRLPGPAARAKLQTQPTLFVGDQGLAGVAWLEGDERGALAVRAAAWDGRRWEAVREVAPRGPGSQLALAGALLADGSWLLVWAAYDGTDDEIVWSRRGADGLWSAPRRLAADNAVPDITPALLAVGGGAVAAWSRFDGETYRLVTARFDGGRWSAPEVAGPAGSLYPTFAATAGGGAFLVYRLALPRGWEVVELDAAGRAGRTAAVTVAGTERPVVRGAGGDGVSLSFPASGETATVAWRPER